MAKKELLTIGEVAEATGLNTSALRYYEREGLIQPAGRAGGRRHYEPRVLRRLAVVSLLQEVGFTISQIAELIRQRGGGWRKTAERKLQEIDAHLERVGAARDLLTAALDCGCSSLESCTLVHSRGQHRNVAERVTLSLRPPHSG